MNTDQIIALIALLQKERAFHQENHDTSEVNNLNGRINCLLNYITPTPNTKS